MCRAEVVMDLPRAVSQEQSFAHSLILCTFVLLAALRIVIMPDSKDNDSKELEEKELEEERTIDHFFNLIQLMLETSPTLEHLLLGGGYDSKDYQAEKEALMKINNSGLTEGTIAGIVTFVSLVAGPPLLKKFVPPKNYKLDAPHKSKTLGTYLFIGARLGVQAVASLVVAAYTTSYFTDEELMLKEIAQTPLLEGRSVIADEFCPLVTREYHRYHSSDYWKQVESPYLQHLGVFVENCDKRQSYEKELRKQQGLPISTHVSIPSPGVPNDYPIDENIYNDEYDDDEHDEWVEAFVTDQEDTNKK